RAMLLSPRSPGARRAKAAIFGSRRFIMWRRFFALVVFLVCFGCLDARSQEFRMIRSEEDWAAQGEQSSVPLKNLSLSQGGSTRLSIGGDIRERWEGFHNELWGEAEEKTTSSFLQRYMLHCDLRLNSRFRFFGQLKSGIETGRRSGARPIDEDLFDLHEAWAEWRFLDGGQARSMALRAGRQEMNLGSGRLVSIREGPNVRLSFDGARLITSANGWSIEGFAMRPHRTKPGVFDDTPDPRQSVWGAYATHEAEGRGSDVYYIGLKRRQREFNAGVGNELRHSFGARLFGAAKAWDYDFEGVWQAGRFGSGTINAWTLASNTGYRWDCILKPRVGVKADVASGDGNPTDGTLGTFNAMFPKGAYFSQADLLGPYNLVDLHPSISVNATERITLTADVDMFWRQSTKDGLYDVPGFVIVPGHGSSARHVGYGTNVSVEWEISRNVTLEGEYQRFLPGRFLREVDLNKTVTYVGLWVSFRF
ncbi:MAG TPA: alginate export family protein, partial [Bryobacteraceae bacterium]|nr:alginate export family protein [Bryobacteraceae bacterium]